MAKVLVFSGSVRKASLNRKLAAVASRFAIQQGAAVTAIDLGEYPLPIYDGDFEDANGQPENAQRLHAFIADHDAMLIASPEYNGLPSPLLKNTIDWVSRVDGKVYAGKVAALVSASPGRLGGLRGLTHLRALLNNLNVLVIPQQLALGDAMHGFDAQGNLQDTKQQAALEQVITALLGVIRK